MAREGVLARTLVQLADNLVEDFDLVDLLTVLVDRCVEVVGVTAAGVMLVAPTGDLRLVASSNEEMRIVELFEIQSDEGPCLDSYRCGEPVVNVDLATVNGRWPHFAPVAFEAGFRSVHALPMRLRGTILGAINLFNATAGAMAEADILAAKALADMASIAIVQHRATIEAQVLNENLQNALNDRLIIEQAKGVLAERSDLEIEQAFSTMRNHARNGNLKLVDVARHIIDGSLDTAALDPPRPA